MAHYASLTNNAPSPEALAREDTLPLFSAAAREFAEALSRQLVSRQDVRRFPELVALGFWLRKANITRIADKYMQAQEDNLTVARGLVFHIAPSNVDTIFIYSWMLALLSGNKNIIRISSRLSEQTNLLVTTIAALLALPEHADIARRTLLVRYPADDATTAMFSGLCDVRVVWGGDNTVSQVRRIALPPTATELTFANKYSLALIHAGNWLKMTPQVQQDAVQAFFNDAYWFDQMACSSPRMVLWQGTPDAIAQARNLFWEQVRAKLLSEHVHLEDADYINKLHASHTIAIDNHVTIEGEQENTLTRIWLDEPALFVQQHCGAGLFIESGITSLDDLPPLLSRTIQTISYLGFDRSDFTTFLKHTPVRGIDRIVPFGQALNFSPTWDGFDLLKSFCRQIVVD